MRALSRRQYAVVATVFTLLLAPAALSKPADTAFAGNGRGLGSAPVLGVPGVFGASKTNLDFSRPYGYHLQPILEKIKASPEQREKIIVVVQSYRAKIQPLRDEYKLKRQEFVAVMTSGAPAETIMAKQVELSHLASEITNRYTLMRLDMRRVMNPQQILLFEDYARQHGWNATH